MTQARHIEGLAQTALLAALALVLSYLETMIPLPVAVPGIKLGLGNVAVLVALWTLGWKRAGAVAVVRVLAAGFLFGSPTMLAYSVCGMALAFAAMLLMRALPGVGVLPASMASAIAHNAGQLVAASMLLGSTAVFATLPLLALAACITGALTGAVAQAAVGLVEGAAAEERPRVELGSFSVEPGELVCFAGANGSGKTTAALQLAAELPGAVIVFQDPDNQIVADAVEDDVAFGLENRGVPRAAMVDEVQRALEAIGAGELRAQQVSALSGGQRQKVAVAGTLVTGPQTVIFDEATSMMDPGAREAFWQLVEHLRSEGASVIVITQRMSEVFRANRVLLFEAGAVRAEAAPAELREQPQLLEELGLGLPEAEPSFEDLRGEGARLISEENACEPGSADEHAREACPGLGCSGLSFAYPGAERAVLSGASLRVAPGEVLGIAGPCGSGKSTLLRCLAGLAEPAEGAVFIDGKAAAPGQLSELVALAFQSPERQLFAATAVEDVCFGPLSQGASEEEALQRARAALEMLGLSWERALEAHPGSYSGGEQRRLALAGILALQRPYLLLDEPTAGLDPCQVAELERLLASLAAQGIGIIVADHNLAFLERSSSAIVLMEQIPSACVRNSSSGSIAQTPPAICVEAAAGAYAEEKVPDACVEAVVGECLYTPTPTACEEATLDASACDASRHACGAAAGGGFGAFSPRETPAHRIDPRAKLVFVALFMAAGCLAASPAALGVIALGALTSLAAAQMGPHAAWRCLRPFLPMMLFVALFDALLCCDGTVWWQAGPIALSSGGLLKAGASVLRFALMLLGTGALMRVTSPTQLTDGATMLLAPLRKLGVRVNDAGLAMGLTLRFVPVISAEMLRIREAQQARGAHFGQPSPVARLKAYLPVIVPLFSSALRCSTQLAAAIVNRGYSSTAPRSCYRRYQLAARDWLALALGCAILIAAIAL